VYTPVRAAGTAIRPDAARVRRRRSHAIRTASAAPCSTASTRFLQSGQTYREFSRVEVPRVDYDKLTGSRLSEPSAAIRARVEKARKLQHARFHDSKLACNADMGPAEVRQFCELDEVSRSLLRSAAQQMQLSARTYHRLLKVGRTIADLAGSERFQTAHPAGAIQYRQRKV
jgi:magnesium chelatase family protein